MRKKIVLYNPKAVFFDLPLALLAIGSNLDLTKYEVIIIDGRIDAHAHKKVIEACTDALCFGTTVLTGRPIKDAVEISRKVKAHNKDLPVIWGGWHPSLFPVEILSDEASVDVTVFGQGEITFREIVTRLCEKGNLASVAGIAYRDLSGNIVKNQKRHLTKMDELKPTDYSLIDVEAYFKKKKNRQFDYISSTGCHFRCTFCADPFVYERAWTSIDPERMGEELQHWKKKFNFTDVNFQDETFFTHRKRVQKIANQFIERDIRSTWAGTMRGDQGFRMTDEEFDHCKESGLRRVLVGVESGSQEMMDWLMKDIKIEHIWKVAERCAERDIGVIFPFIVGFPSESIDSVYKSLTMARKLNLMHEKFVTPIFYFKPYPGSKITNDVVKEGYHLPQSLDEWMHFDYVESSGPWVDKRKYQLIERFKFYNKVAGRNRSLASKPLQWLAKQRLKNFSFGFPIEKQIADIVLPSQRLS